MGLSPDTQNYGLRMRWEYRKRFPRHRRLAIPTRITSRAWCKPGSLTSGFLWSRWRGKRSHLPGASTTRKFAYLVRGNGRTGEYAKILQLLLQISSEADTHTKQGQFSIYQVRSWENILSQCERTLHTYVTFSPIGWYLRRVTWPNWNEMDPDSSCKDMEHFIWTQTDIYCLVPGLVDLLRRSHLSPRRNDG